MVNNNCVNTNFNTSTTGQPLLQPTQPAFCVNLVTTTTNVTGDGTTYTIPYDGVIKDQTSSYNAITGVYTAPITGKYWFYAAINGIIGVTNPTSSIFKIVTTSITTQIGTNNPVNLSTGAASFTQAGGCIVSMTAGDTASCTIQMSGGTKNSYPEGAVSTTPVTYFGGYLIC
jgi:hypothetical protein